MTQQLLFNAQQGHAEWLRLWSDYIKPHLMAGRRMVVDVKEATRSLEQNALLHALLSEIAINVIWAGKRRSIEVWKRLLTAAWLRARGESVEVLPAIDGHGIDVVFRATSNLTIAECADLITYIQAWAAEQGLNTDRQPEPEFMRPENYHHPADHDEPDKLSTNTWHM